MNQGKFIFDFARLDTMAVNDLIPFGKLQDNGTYKLKNIRNTDFLNELIVSSPVTRSELQALIAASGLIAGKFYTITNAAGGTLSLVGQAVSSNLLGEYAVSTTTGETYKYDITTDTAILEPNPIALGTANQLLGVNAGATAQEYKTLSGTANQVVVTNGVGGITLSLPQSIATTSTPTFAGMTLTAPLGIASGGTGLSSTPTNGQIDIGNGTGFTRATLTGTANQVVVTSGAGSITLSLPQSIATTSSPTFNSLILTTALAAPNGGTGQSSYAVGDILYASTTTALSKLADVATGNALISGGVNTAPSWGKIGLTTHVSGTLPIANGGTNNTAVPTNGQLLIGNGTTYVLAGITGTANQVTVTNGAGTITLSLPQSIATTSSPTFANGTFTGTLGITGAVTGSSTAQFTNILANQAAGNSRGLQILTSGVARWYVRANTTAESGSNIGSDFTITRYNDAGSIIDSPVTITRSTGNIAISTALGVTGALSLGTGNAVAASVATPSTHKVTIVINGTTYYLLASNV